MTSLLEVQGLTAGYGDFQALFGVDLNVERGQTVAVIGANGAGKTTFLRAVTGMIPSAHSAVRYEGRPIGGARPEAVVRQGVAMVPEGRKLFPSLTVEENLRMGGLSRRKGPWTLDRVYKLFPLLQEKRRAPATTLSGGQQQMVAIGRALMSNPALLLCDELSLGLAPIVVRDLYAILPAVTAEGSAVLVIEQDITQALNAAQQIYCFQEGRVTLSGSPSSMTREAITSAYFGV